VSAHIGELAGKLTLVSADATAVCESGVAAAAGA
jgi:hypothetical protein